jgi:hypothetical protein
MFSRPFTKHCTERMNERNITQAELEYVLKKGFFHHQATHGVYKVEYGKLVIIIDGEGRFITAYNKYSKKEEAQNADSRLYSDAKYKRCRRKKEAMKIADMDREIKYAA